MRQLFQTKMENRPEGEAFQVATNPIIPVLDLKADPTRVDGLLWQGLQELASGLIDFVRQTEEKAGPDQNIGILFLGMPVCLPGDDPARQEVGFVMFQHVMAIPAAGVGCRELPFGKAYLAESPFHLGDYSLIQSPQGRSQIAAEFAAKMPEYLGLTDIPEWQR